MSVTNIYTSVACNPTTECADWGHNGLILFAANNAVVLYDPEYKNYSAKIIQTYVKHTKRVNFVCWLQPIINSNHEGNYFLTGSDDCLAILWCIKEQQQYNNPITFEMKGHQSGVNAAAGLQRSNGCWILATSSADSSIKLWLYDNQFMSSVMCTQTLLLSTGFCFCLKLAVLPETDIAVLAFSADDESVQLWTEKDSQMQFAHKFLGHENWVRGLDFVVVNDVDLLLASCSQDNFIRLWRISRRNLQQIRNNEVDIFNILNESGDIRMEETIIQPTANLWYAISLESVLYGHEGWVYGVHWHKSKDQSLSLLSASIDKTLIIWQPVKDEGNIWMEKVRLGEIGGNSLGFFGAKFSSDGQSVLGYSYQGGLHVWQCKNENDAPTIWVPQVIVSGHNGEVRDLAWEPQGQYLMTASSDQTTRIHAPWRKISGNFNENSEKIEQWSWHELARPQIHGYEMQALTILTRYRFVSGAEEKIVRAFQAPANFIENFRKITKVQSDVEGDALLKNLPKCASIPSLGLSNKAIYNIELLDSAVNEKRLINDEYPENYFVPKKMDTPPQEETLMQNTLWPEVQKLYGHGYEIYALTSSPDGRILASSCKSTTAEYSQIILWSTSTWKQIQKLAGHQLTVTQMRFSPNGRYLLSVSRDRCWLLFECQQQQQQSDTNLSTYKLIANTDKTNGLHSRIIWSCDWSHDSKYFVTSSRDGKVVIWTRNEKIETKLLESSLNGWKEEGILNQKMESITAVAFAPYCRPNNSYIVALGCERGFIYIYQFDGNWTNLLTLDQMKAHHMSVKRLQYRPRKFISQDYYELASCGEDHFVKIYGIQF